MHYKQRTSYDLGNACRKNLSFLFLATQTVQELKVYAICTAPLVALNGGNRFHGDYPNTQEQ